MRSDTVRTICNSSSRRRPRLPTISLPRPAKGRLRMICIYIYIYILCIHTHTYIHILSEMCVAHTAPRFAHPVSTVELCATSTSRSRPCGTLMIIHSYNYRNYKYKLILIIITITSIFHYLQTLELCPAFR